MKRFFLLLSSFFLSGPAFAAACCGGGFASPSLIAGDDQAQLTASYSYSRVETDVGSDSYWRRRDAGESSGTYRIEGAWI
ncbi:MAG: serine protease spb1, partial [Bdellovibrionota bacterium]